jgi:hypothetical protein
MLEITHNIPLLQCFVSKLFFQCENPQPEELVAGKSSAQEFPKSEPKS